ncbi:MAG: glycine cleavage system aminomethyltransferase GcvT [Betaproteobacteria bacterium]|nr:glycine cleavage system aminomethyltransferase GcvT [Betaproteobacteria bacterium]
MQRTPLYAAHVELAAKMVDFGGWEMPLHYGSQLEEHHAVRKGAGMFDVSHMRPVEIEGASAREFLQHLLANDVAKLTVAGRALYSCMLNEKGGVIDDLIVYFLTPTHYRLVVNAGTAAKDIAWLETQNAKWKEKLKITPRHDVAMIAVQGPLAREKVWAALPGSEAVTRELKPFYAASHGDIFIARTGYTGEDGFEIIVPADQAVGLWQRLHQLGVAPAGLGARDTLRLEAGMNLYGQDMNDDTLPTESGLTWTVDTKSERAFNGRAVLEAQPPQRNLYGLLLTGSGILRAHQVVQTPFGNGEITSGTFSPTLQKSIALARLPATVKVGDVVKAQVRNQWQDCRVVKFPFVRNGQSLLG